MGRLRTDIVYGICKTLKGLSKMILVKVKAFIDLKMMSYFVFMQKSLTKNYLCQQNFDKCQT